MAKPVIWSEEAFNDIESIAKYISRDSVYYAQMVVDRIIAAGEVINVYPESGRIVPELEEEHIREKFIYSYRLIYEIEATSINILAIIHGKQLLESDGRFNHG
jgi:plasmid stabilization system protein ParE